MRALNYFIIVSSIIAGLKSPVSAQSVEVHNFQFKKTEKKSQSVVAPYKESKKKNPEFKKWEGSFGLGVFSGGNGRNDYSSSETWQAYVFGGRYFFNEYFDLNAEMFYPRGSNSYGGDQQTHGPLFKIGAGTTPIHFTFLGYPFWEWGFDGGVLLGSNRYLDGENMLFFLGFRQSVNFTRSWSLTYNLNVEISRVSNVRAATGGLKMAYRW